MSKLNYKGITAPNISEIVSKNVIKIEDHLRKLYTERLETFNKENLKTNPEPFRFLKKENCSTVSFFLPFEFNRSHAMITFLLSTPGKRVEIFHTLNDEDFSDIDSYELWQYFFYDKILPAYEYSRDQVILEFVDLYSNFEMKNGFTLFEENCNHINWINNQSLTYKVIDIIKKETSQFKEINETPLSYFAKDAYKFPFSLMDLKPLIELINDDDFSYQLDQAMAAYHANLFLPSAATLGVVLETLCIKIVKVHNIKIKTGDTQLGVLLLMLRENQITTRRDHSRLEIAYRMRNLASHSNPGAALKEDCHFMLNVINTIAFEYLQREE